jgi:hypothetical protein
VKWVKWLCNPGGKSPQFVWDYVRPLSGY